MKIWISAIVTTLCSSALADDLKSIIENIAEPNFEVRTKARLALKNYSTPYSKEKLRSLIDSYSKSNSPEVRLSIKLAIKNASKKDELERLYGKGFLGVSYTGTFLEVNGKNLTSISVESVVPDGPAQKADLKIGDIIYEVAGENLKISNKRQFVDPNHQLNLVHDAFSKIIKGYKKGDKVEIAYARKGKFLKTTVTLGSFQEHVAKLNGGDGFSEEAHRQFEVEFERKWGTMRNAQKK